MNYQQLTENERYMLSALRKQGLNNSQIANALGRHRSTISREIARNSCWVTDCAYRPSKAQRRTQARRSRSRRNRRLTPDDFILVEMLLGLEWSPEQIVGYLKRHNRPCVSHESICQYIWADKANGGELWKKLRQSTKQRRKRYRSYDSRGRLAAKRNIAERPQDVEDRKTFGHWEIDTVMGKGSKHCIVTLVERKSGYTVIGQLNDRTTYSLNNRAIDIMQRSRREFATITADNGTEFHQYPTIEEATKTTFYFANPHHSWERGTNENTNGLIRQYLPKGTSMASITQADCESIAKRLNNRPRKRLGYKTPEEVFNEH
ncbi:IS30 family transposase [Corallincola spongiicola]|uniref:IS30 family transposase n=1 Tax=Corallincola spongiicola TaxID=2520508 RepID=A0ABY1WR96_9GAMM|nr:IS30 family transposase [Corallincola spongiicola]TAA47261.1 IS30 family transposase [Corallincola spongiicola]